MANAVETKPGPLVWRPNPIVGICECGGRVFVATTTQVFEIIGGILYPLVFSNEPKREEKSQGQSVRQLANDMPHLGFPIEGIMPAWALTVIDGNGSRLTVAFSRDQAKEIAARINDYYESEPA